MLGALEGEAMMGAIVGATVAVGEGATKGAGVGVGFGCVCLGRSVPPVSMNDPVVMTPMQTKTYIKPVLRVPPEPLLDPEAIS